MRSTILFVPGLRDHVAEHWQTLLAADLPGSRTVPPLEHDKLSRAARVEALDRAIAAIDGPVILVAHSAGCLMVAHWAQQHGRPIRGALLATPADIERPLPAGYPTLPDLQANGWLPLPRSPLPFPSIVAASSGDPLAGGGPNGGSRPQLVEPTGPAGQGRTPQSRRRIRSLARRFGAAARPRPRGRRLSATQVLAGAPSEAALTQSLGAMEGLPLGVEATRRQPASGARALLLAVYPGLLAALTIALAATWLSQHYRVPVMLFALLFGMAFNFLHDEGRCVAGINFVSKSVLRVGVALLGAKITAGQILGLGVMPLVTVVVGVASTIGLGALASKRFGQSRAFGVLTGGAVGICGASAALAIASILPQTEESERNTILAVVTVTALSTIAMITYPLIAAVVGLDHAQAGIFLGGTIHDVAQVVGAGYTVSPQTGDIATYVKLLRVALLLPAVLVLGLAWRRTAARSGEARAQTALPALPPGLCGPGCGRQLQAAAAGRGRRGLHALALVSRGGAWQGSE